MDKEEDYSFGQQIISIEKKNNLPQTMLVLRKSKTQSNQKYISISLQQQ
jgi:hypothetical protein